MKISEQLESVITESVSTKPASELKAGDMVVERGGSVFEIEKVSESGGKVTITFKPGPSIITPSPATVKASAQVRVSA